MAAQWHHAHNTTLRNCDIIAGTVSPLGHLTLRGMATLHGGDFDGLGFHCLEDCNGQVGAAQLDECGVAMPIPIMIVRKIAMVTGVAIRPAMTAGSVTIIRTMTTRPARRITVCGAVMPPTMTAVAAARMTARLSGRVQWPT